MWVILCKMITREDDSLFARTALLASGHGLKKVTERGISYVLESVQLNAWHLVSAPKVFLGLSSPVSLVSLLSEPGDHHTTQCPASLDCHL